MQMVDALQHTQMVDLPIPMPMPMLMPILSSQQALPLPLLGTAVGVCGEHSIPSLQIVSPGQRFDFGLDSPDLYFGGVLASQVRTACKPVISALPLVVH